MKMKAACYCGTRNLYADMIPAVKSLLKNSDVDRVYLLIEDDVFPYELQECVETINVSNQKWFHRDGPNFNSEWTYMVLMRAALHRIFPELDRILSLDTDTIVEHDISELWDIPLDDYYFAGVKEPYKSKRILYVNAGVLVLNLKKLRDDGKGDSIINELNTRSFWFNEQDCMNVRCQGGILELPGEYNNSLWTTQADNPKIIHFSGIPDWRDSQLVKMYRDMDW